MVSKKLKQRRFEPLNLFNPSFWPFANFYLTQDFSKYGRVDSFLAKRLSLLEEVDRLAKRYLLFDWSCCPHFFDNFPLSLSALQSWHSRGSWVHLWNSRAFFLVPYRFQMGEVPRDTLQEFFFLLLVLLLYLFSIQLIFSFFLFPFSFLRGKFDFWNCRWRVSFQGIFFQRSPAPFPNWHLCWRGHENCQWLLSWAFDKYVHPTWRDACIRALEKWIWSIQLSPYKRSKNYCNDLHSCCSQEKRSFFLFD